MGIAEPVVAYSEECIFVPSPVPSEGDYIFDPKAFNPSIFAEGTFDDATGTFKGGQWGFGGWEFAEPIDLSGYKYLVAELYEDERDSSQLRVFDTEDYKSVPYSSSFNAGKLIVAELDGMMKNLPDGIRPLNTANVHRVGFWGFGKNPIRIKQVFATNTNPYDVTVEKQ